MHNPLFEQFGNYPELGWAATVAGQFYKEDDKFQINPDLDNFKLVRFIDLRKGPKPVPTTSKLMLIGSSKTNVFMDGPDAQINEVVKRLPHYIDKAWLEIKNMSLDKDFLHCKNAFSELCNQWIIDNMIWDIYEPGKGAKELDLLQADKICAECKNFEFTPVISGGS